MDPPVFFGRYGMLGPDCKDAKALITKIGLADQWQIGKTQLFMRDDMYFALETARGSQMENSVKIIQGLLKVPQLRPSSSAVLLLQR